MFLRESLYSTVKSTHFFLELFLMSLHLLRNICDRKSFKLTVRLGLGFVEVIESLYSLFFWHETRSRRMLRQLFIKGFLFSFLISLLIVLVKVAGNLTVVFISACNCLFFSCSLLFRLHIKGSLIQIGFDKVFLLAWL